MQITKIQRHSRTFHVLNLLNIEFLPYEIQRHSRTLHVLNHFKYWIPTVWDKDTDGRETSLILLNTKSLSYEIQRCS